MFFDAPLFFFINGFAGKWPPFDIIAIFCAVYLGYLLLLALVVFLLVDFKRYWRVVSEAVVAALLVRFVLVEILSTIHFRARPFVYNHVNLLVPYHSDQTSFPSGHASFYFALSTMIYCYNKKIGSLFFAASLLISFSRVFVGVHWPLDIFAGAVLGIFMGLVLHGLFRYIKHKERTLTS